MSQRWIRAALVVINLVLILLIAAAWGYAWRLDRRVVKALAEPKPPKVEKPAEPAATPETPATTDTVTTDTATTTTTDTASTDTSTTVAQPAMAAEAASAESKDAGRRERREGRRSRDREGRRRPDMAQGPMPPGSMPGAPGGAPADAGGLPAELAGLLKSKALFGRTPPPNVMIQGVIGDQVLINNQWLSPGGSAGPVKLLEINGDTVVVEIDGMRQERKIWQDMPNPPPPPSQAQAHGAKPPAPEAKPPSPAELTAFGGKIKQKWAKALQGAGRFAGYQGLGQKAPVEQPATDAPSPETASMTDTDTPTQ